MKKFIFKYLQQVIIAAVVITAMASIGFAAPSLPLTSGFVRTSLSQSEQPWSSNQLQHFLYGYGNGFINNNLQFGYGYGYYNGARTVKPNAGDYGFFGDDGAVTVDDITTTQTTATIEYSTNYLARFSYGYALSSPVNEFNVIGSDDDNINYFSGAQQISLSNLACGTIYYITITAKDAENHHWSITTPFTTSSCSGITSSGSHGTQQQFAFGEPGKGLDGSTTDLPKSPWLKYGDFGPGPKSLQKALNQLGFTVAIDGGGSPGHETSFFGSKTKVALKKFQKAHGLEEDGIFGPKTKAALEAAMK